MSRLFVDYDDFDLNKVIVESPEEKEITGGGDEKKGKKGKKNTTSYGSLQIAYEYPTGKGRLRIQMPQMKVSGITTFEAADGGNPKNQIGTPPLTPDQIKFFEKLRVRILELITPYITKGESTYSEKLAKKLDMDDLNPSNVKAFRPIHRNSEKNPDVYRLYPAVKPWSAFHLPTTTSKGPSTEVLKHDKIRQTEKRRLEMDSRLIWEATYVYVSTNKSIIHQVYQCLIKKISVHKNTSDQIKELNDMFAEGDYDEDENRRALAELENMGSDDSDDSDDPDDPEPEEKEEKPKSKAKGKAKLSKMMESDSEEEEPKKKPTKKSAKKLISDEENDSD